MAKTLCCASKSTAGEAVKITAAVAEGLASWLGGGEKVTLFCAFQSFAN